VSELGGYVTDVPYVRGFKPMLAPAWLDLVAVISGVTPPARDRGFAYCDLGCGQGVTAAILAATHPSGEFHGIDAMPAHVAHAERLAAEADVRNARFHATDFNGAGRLALPRFDYIVAHGVYTWVDEPTRAALRRFIDGRLKSGGLAYVSYNALPGWTGDLPFQHLVRELAAVHKGDSAARFAGAAGTIRQLAEAGVTRLADSHIVTELRDRPDDYRPGYVVHEFMHTGWRPAYVTEVRRDFAEIGLMPAGSATLVENFDGWTLSRRGRALVASVADPDRRELVRDFLIDQRFRCDVFTRDARRLDTTQQRQRLIEAGLALARPAAAIGYEAPAPSGRLLYDNAAARAAVAGLAAGAKSLAEIAPNGIAQQDLIANALALAAGSDIRPVEKTRTPVQALNRALRRRLGGPEEIPVLALPCGTALDIDAELLGLMRGEFAGERGMVWREFLAMHGID
jgi:SAM-dependent methyltransferase